MSFDFHSASKMVSFLLKMPYGSEYVLDRHQWAAIVPQPDPMRQLLLASAGHRPETEREPEDWFRFWLNGTSDDDFMITKREPYRVHIEPVRGRMHIYLPVGYCPKCHGSGRRPKFPELSVCVSRGMEAVAEAIAIEFEACDHTKK